MKVRPSSPGRGGAVRLTCGTSTFVRVTACHWWAFAFVDMCPTTASLHVVWDAATEVGTEPGTSNTGFGVLRMTCDITGSGQHQHAPACRTPPAASVAAVHGAAHPPHRAVCDERLGLPYPGVGGGWGGADGGEQNPGQPGASRLELHAAHPARTSPGCAGLCPHVACPTFNGTWPGSRRKTYCRAAGMGNPQGRMGKARLCLRGAACWAAAAVSSIGAVGFCGARSAGRSRRRCLAGRRAR